MGIPSQSSSRGRARQKTISRTQARDRHAAADVIGRYAAPRESIGFVVRQVYRGVARSLETRAEVLVEKHRHGATNKIDLYFDDRFTRFSNLVQEN